MLKKDYLKVYKRPEVIDMGLFSYEGGCVTTSFDLDDGTEIIGDGGSDLDW